MLGEQPEDRSIPWGQVDDVLVRDPDHDTEGKWAWRDEKPCDDTCHHPVHAFQVPKGARHLDWFEPGDKSLSEPYAWVEYWSIPQKAKRAAYRVNMPHFVWHESGPGSWWLLPESFVKQWDLTVVDKPEGA